MAKRLAQGPYVEAHAKSAVWFCRSPLLRGTLWMKCVDARVPKDAPRKLYAMLQNRVQLVKNSTDKSLTWNSELSVVAVALQQIQLDLDRTLPRLRSGEKKVFGIEGSKGAELAKILGSFAAHRPDVGYCQGMSFLAAIVALHIDDEVDQFHAFVHVVGLPFMYAAYTFNMDVVRSYFAHFDNLVNDFLPGVWHHFKRLKVEYSIFLTEWWFTCFVRSLPLEIARRFWDAIFVDGEVALFCCALALLNYLQQDILDCESFDDVLMILTACPSEIDSTRFWELWDQEHWHKNVRIHV